MNALEINLLVNLIMRLMPAIERIIAGQIRQEDIDWNDLLKKNDFLDRAIEIKRGKDEVNT